MNLYKHIYGLALRVTPSASSFLLLLCIDYFVVNKQQELWALDFILIYPILMPFFRMGAPLYLMEQETLGVEKKLGVYRILQILAGILLYIMFVFGLEMSYLSIALLSVVGAILFNSGLKRIRNGNHFGYLLQNVIIYLFISILLLTQVEVFSAIKLVIGVLLIGLILREYKQVVKLRSGLLKLNRFKVNYIGDIANSFVVPILLFCSYKVSNQSDPAMLFVLKITGFISGTVGGLIILNIKRMDHATNNDLIDVFRKLKKELLYIYLALALLSNVAVGILYPKYIIVSIGLTIFEGLILMFGQYNTLLIFKKKKKQSVFSNFITIIFITIFFLLATPPNVSVNIFLFYIIGASVYQAMSYLAFKYY